MRLALRLNISLMISDKKLRSTFGLDEFELGLNSVAYNDRKKSCTTESCTSDSIQDNKCDSLNRCQPSSQDSSADRTLQQLRLKLLKLSDHKANMELRFKKQIVLLNNELSVMNSEQNMLTQVASELKADVQDLRNDLEFVKSCLQTRDMRLSVSPELSRENRVIEKHSPRGKPSRLFRANMLKIK